MMRFSWILLVFLLHCPVRTFADGKCSRDMPLDISLVIDKTKSLGKPNFITMKKVVASMMEQFAIGEEHSHVSVMSYSGKPTIYNDLNDDRYHSTSAIKELILGMSDSLGNPTRTDMAMEAVRDIVFRPEAGDRPGYSNLMVLFTDGGTKQPDSTPYEQITPGMEAKDIVRVAVGIGRGIKPDELRRIAGSSEQTVTAPNFDELKIKVDEIIKTIKELSCAVNGEYSEWSEWSECSVTCGEGTTSRTRTCTNPPPEGIGKDCSRLGAAKEEKDCNPGPCPVDGKYTPWSEWSACSVTCGDGVQTKTRTCTNPAPQFEGKDCSDQGDPEETKECNLAECPIDGKYTEWSEWSDCSVTCGAGTQKRTRSCTNPAPEHEGKNCIAQGKPEETQPCNMGICPVDGGYTDWAPWSKCSVTCDGGVQIRKRTCSNPVPVGDGRDCKGLGPAEDKQDCNTDICPIDGGYTEWTVWEACSVTCGGGVQKRKRSCTNPTPKGDGKSCEDLGPPEETQECNPEICPVDGGYTPWTSWTSCPVTCGGGVRKRERTCTKPPPEGSGRDCSHLGSAEETEKCGEKECPVDGGYTDWTPWSKCSATCGGGEQMRTRECTNPTPVGSGNDCQHLGDDKESQECNPQKCPVDGGYTTWTPWSKCSVTCGGGNQERSRTCTNPLPQGSGADCSSLGDSKETQECNKETCPVDGGYATWSHWSECTVTCGGGTRSRSRTCTNPIPEGSGRDCSGLGPKEESEKCNANTCPVDGGYTPWSDWGECSVTCGGGTQERTRRCANPAPAGGGADCRALGEAHESRKCNPEPCACSPWSCWSTCSAPCGGGSQVRTRTCPPGHPSCDKREESQECNPQPCL